MKVSIINMPELSNYSEINIITPDLMKTLLLQCSALHRMTKLNKLVNITCITFQLFIQNIQHKRVYFVVETVKYSYCWHPGSLIHQDTFLAM